MKPILVLTALLAVAGPALAASDPRARLLTDADALAAHLGDRHLVVLHVGDPAVYAAGHVPGARLLPQGYFTKARGSDSQALTLELPDPKALQMQLQQLGIGRDSRIVVVHGKDELVQATRAIHVLDAAGWGDRVSLLDGGLPEWQRRGHPLSTEPPPKPVPTKLTPPKMHPHAVDLVYLQDHKPGAKLALLDARPAPFFNGVERSKYPHGEAPAGRIPGATSLPVASLLTPEGRLQPQDVLRRIFNEAGAVPGKKVAVYCNVGQQASAVLFAARLLGLDAALYDGSFQEWTMHGMPVETPGGGAVAMP